MTWPHRSPIANRILKWFAAHKRDLPWREEPRDPYHVWLSEVMLQQTQVATVIPYYERWLQRLPKLKDLANAPLDDVLKLWEGLGYYARARNFHTAAQVVMRDYSGQIPHTVDELMKLPGIGRYTAGAIASLAFNQYAPALDGNVKRVLSRVFALTTDDALWQLAESLLPKDRVGEFNEALMDLGATICMPRAPDCPRCPVRTLCRAYASGNPEAYPAKASKKATPHRHIGTAIVVDPAGRILMEQRPRDGLLGGLWQFISTEFERDLDGATPKEYAPQLRRMLLDKARLRVRIGADHFVGQVKHTFTHFRMTRYVFVAYTSRASANDTHKFSNGRRLRWLTRDEISRLALTRSDHKILELLERILSTDLRSGLNG
jgi:A/G-specific adenine glycosylase